MILETYIAISYEKRAVWYWQTKRLEFVKVSVIVLFCHRNFAYAWKIDSRKRRSVHETGKNYSLASLDIMGAQLRTPLKPLNAIVLWWSWGFSGEPPISRWCREMPVSRTAVPDQCCYFFLLFLCSRCVVTQACIPEGDTEKTMFPFPFTLNGIWSWWPFSFRF